MSKIVKSNGKIIPKVRGFKIAENEDKDNNEGEDDIQNIENLDLQKQKKNQQKKQSINSSKGVMANQQTSKVYAQDISLMEEELEDQLAHPNQARRHTFKNKMRNKSNSSSSDREEFMKTSSESDAAQKIQSNKKAIGNPKKNNQSNLGSTKQTSKSSAKVTTKEGSKLSTNSKQIIDQPQKRLKREAIQGDFESEQSYEKSEEEQKKIIQDKQKQVNNKENVKNGNQDRVNQISAKLGSNNKAQNNQVKQNKVMKIQDLFSADEIQFSKVSQKESQSELTNKRRNIQQEAMVNVEECSEEKEEEEVQQIIGYSSSLLKKSKGNIKNKLNNSFDSESGFQSDGLSMQPQGAISSQFDSKSLSIANLQEIGEDDSIICNYSNILDYDLDYNDKSIDIQSNLNNIQEDDEDSDHIQIKKKANISSKKKEDEKNNHVISSDSCLLMHSKENSQKSKPTKLSNFSKQKQESSNKNENLQDSNFHAASANILGSNGNKKKDAKELKNQMISDFGLKQNNNSSMIYKNEQLKEISEIEEEFFEIFELPKDKTRVLWIFNSVHFIERLTNNEHFLEGQEICTQNGKKWSLQISYSEKQQQIECVFSRQNKNDTSKQQLYYVFKFYALSKTENIIDKSYNGNKTFSPESLSQSFTFPLDIELILEKYQHIIFELTLTPIRLQHYNSKEETNYVGLLNEGQTCYMNSYLQTLFHIKAFVKLVYSIPTERESASVFPHSLQVLFYQLQSRGYHCTTTELLKSFSWDRSKARIQQDVQEFSCLFIEYLESKAERIPQLKGQIKHLFQGKIQNYIKCINVEYESVREESFFEISLNLKGCKNLYESLDDYVKEELLENDNKYDTGDVRYQKQDAKKGIKILELPPVLFFHLKRFQFDYQTGRNVKIVDQHEYQQEIDMQNYIANPSADECYKYNLFAVLVHSGDFSSSGHYYAYIRPNPMQNNWFKFNDAIVEKASRKQVLDHSFGGKAFFKGFDKNKRQLIWESTSINSTAYMLVYINQREIDKIVGEIPLHHVPKWVIEQEEQLIQDYLLKQKLSKIVEIRMTSFDLLKKQQQTCGVYFQKQTKRDEQPEMNESIIFRKEIDKCKTYKEFYQELCQEIGVEQEDIGIWKIDYLSNGSERITNQIKKIATNGSELIDKAYFENLSYQSNSSSSNNQTLAPILLILPISTTKFGGNKQIFQIGQDGHLEIKKQEQLLQNGEKRLSSQNDWNKYFQFQEGSLMLIIIKSFEYTRDGVKIQFIDYVYFNPLSNFSQFAEEITKKKKLDVCQFKFYKEENYSVTQLTIDAYGQTLLKNIFNSTDCGVLVISYESKLAKDNNISIISYYKQLEDQVRVRFVSSQIAPSSNNSVNLSIQNNSNNKNLSNSSMKNNFQNNQNVNINPFLQDNKPNDNQTDSIQFLNNFTLNNLLPSEGVQFEKIFLKTVKYSQLQINLFNSLKEYFREQLKLFYPLSESPNSMESEEIIKSSTMLINPKKQMQNINPIAIEQFLNLDDSFHQYIYLKCKIRKRNIEEIPFFQSAVSETSLNELTKHFDNTIIIYFDFSKALRARDRDQKLIIEYALYSNQFNKIYPNQILDIEKTANIQALSNLLKQQKFFKEYLQAEQANAQSQNLILPSIVKVCQLSKDNPNRIELYYPESAKLNTIKKNQLIRIELQREIQESEIFFICHQTTKSGVETFDNPFSFPLSCYNKVKEIKNRVIQILTDRQIIFDGKKIEVNRDNIQLVLYSEYSKYDSTSLQVDDQNEKSIKHEIDTDSFKNKCGFLEIQHINIVSSTDNKAIKFDMN